MWVYLKPLQYVTMCFFYNLMYIIALIASDVESALFHQVIQFWCGHVRFYGGDSPGRLTSFYRLSVPQALRVFDNLDE